MTKKIKKRNWLSIAIILLVATILDLFIPDPIALIDEIGLIVLTIFSFYKSLKEKR